MRESGWIPTRTSGFRPLGAARRNGLRHRRWESVRLRRSQFAILAKDDQGEFLDGSHTYTLNITTDGPAANFWSIVVYEPQTRSELQTGQPFPSKNNKRDKLATNADGSVDVTFGPEPPADNAENWIQIVPGKGWFILLRLYAPLEPWFDKTWRPGELHKIN